MIIGFDGKRAVENNTGLGNYSRLLVEVLAAKYPDNKYLLYAPRLKENPRLMGLLSRSNVDIVTPESTFGRAIGSMWRSKGITPRLSHDGVNLYHGLSGELPLNIGEFDGPTVLTIHRCDIPAVPGMLRCHRPENLRLQIRPVGAGSDKDNRDFRTHQEGYHGVL